VEVGLLQLALVRISSAPTRAWSSKDVVMGVEVELAVRSAVAINWIACMLGYEVL